MMTDPGAEERRSEGAAASEVSSEVKPGEGGPAPRPSWTRRFAPLILIAGAIAAVVTFLPHMPKQRRVELRLYDAPTIVDVELSVAKAGDGEAVQGNAWHFAPGSAPASLGTSLNLADGRYEIDVTVQRTESRTSLHRLVSVGDSDQIAIPVR
jgi:hypothetical protein